MIALASAEKGLGRGLTSLLGDAALQSQDNSTAIVPISQVEPGMNQPRKRFDDNALQDLADSIREHGLIQPLTVRRLSSGYYQIIAGERRWRASKLAGLTELPVSIIEADDKKVMELGLIENLQREDLNPMEEAKGYQVLMEEHSMTQEEVAQRMGKNRSTIANALRLLSLPDGVQFLLEEGKLSTGHAKAVLSAPSPSLQKQLAQRVITDGLSVRQTESLAKTIGKEKAPPKADPFADQKIYIADLEKDLSSRFGRKVMITPGKSKSKIELEYYDLDDLDTLLALLKGGQ